MKKEFKPSGYNSVSPYLIVNGAQKMIDLLKQIFDAKELRKYDMPDGTIMHVYVPNVDETFKKAISAGCQSLEPPKEREGDPDRRGSFRDFEGNIWSVGTQLVSGEW